MNEMTQTVVAEASAKRERKMNTTLDLEHMTVTFTVKGYEDSPIVVRTADYDDEVFKHATLHGFSQKLADACAGEKDAKVVWQTLTDGAYKLKEGWSVRVPGAGKGAGKDESLLSEAIVLYISNKYLDPDKAAAAHAKAADPEIRKKLAATVEIKALKARLQAERAAGRSADEII